MAWALRRRETETNYSSSLGSKASGWEKKNGFPEVQVATVSDKRRPRGKAPSLYDGPGCWGVSGPCEAGIFSGLEARG